MKYVDAAGAVRVRRNVHLSGAKPMATPDWGTALAEDPLLCRFADAYAAEPGGIDPGLTLRRQGCRQTPRLRQNDLMVS